MSGLLALLVLLQLFPTLAPVEPVAAPQVPPLLDVSEYVGWWGKHGVSLTVTDNGMAVASWRTYTWCAAGAMEACDRIEDHVIIDGGRGVFMLSETRDGGLLGTVVSSTDQRMFSLGPIELRLTGDGGLDLQQDGRVRSLCSKALWATEDGRRRCGA